MKRKPLKEESILKGIFLFILIAGVLAFIVELIAFYFGYLRFDINKARTIVLTTGIMFEMFFVFTCRTNKPLQKVGFFTNKFLIMAIILSILIHIIAIYTPINTFLHLVPLGFLDWIKILGLSISGLVLFEIGKNIKYKIHKR